MLLFTTILILHKKYEEAITCINMCSNQMEEKKLLNANLQMYRGFILDKKGGNGVKEGLRSYERAIKLFKSV